MTPLTTTTTTAPNRPRKRNNRLRGRFGAVVVVVVPRMNGWTKDSERDQKGFESEEREAEKGRSKITASMIRSAFVCVDKNDSSFFSPVILLHPRSLTLVCGVILCDSSQKILQVYITAWWS